VTAFPFSNLLWVSWQRQCGKAPSSPKGNQTIEVEGNQYFPPDAIRKEYFKPSEQHSVCPWKGTASYYDVEVNGKRNAGAAWYYPEPKPAAKQIKEYVAFWKGVKVEK
jgi:uncharacterized protein (DUF427 family)